MSPKKRGRPLKFDPVLADRIVELVRAGNYVETAALAAGITKDTFYDWLKQGGRGREPYKSFSDAVFKAQHEAEAIDVVRTSKAAQSDWKAAAWRLERKNPQRWGPRIIITVAAELDAFFDHLQANLPPEQYERVLELAAQIQPGGSGGVQHIARALPVAVDPEPDD